MDIDYVRLYDQARNYGRRLLRTDMDAEEFAAYVIERKLEGSTSSFNQLYVDYMRTGIGGTGFGREGQRLGIVTAISTDIKGVEADPGCQTVQKPAPDLALLEALDGKERIVAILYIIWGLNMKEIGHVLGITESRTSQIFTATREQLKDIATVNEKRQAELAKIRAERDEEETRRLATLRAKREKDRAAIAKQKVEQEEAARLRAERLEEEKRQAEKAKKRRMIMEKARAAAAAKRREEKIKQAETTKLEKLVLLKRQRLDLEILIEEPSTDTSKMGMLQHNLKRSRAQRELRKVKATLAALEKPAN